MAPVNAPPRALGHISPRAHCRDKLCHFESTFSAANWVVAGGQVQAEALICAKEGRDASIFRAPVLFGSPARLRSRRCAVP